MQYISSLLGLSGEEVPVYTNIDSVNIPPVSSTNAPNASQSGGRRRYRKSRKQRRRSQKSRRQRR
jgi:hypothetical protein